MRHDYDLPPDWASMSPEERDSWFHAERSRRQAMNQETPSAKRIENELHRVNRRLKARNHHVIGED